MKSLDCRPPETSETCDWEGNIESLLSHGRGIEIRVASEVLILA